MTAAREEINAMILPLDTIDPRDLAAGGYKVAMILIAWQMQELGEATLNSLASCLLNQMPHLTSPQALAIVVVAMDATGPLEKHLENILNDGS